MKPDEILEKTLKGELLGEALTAEVEKLTVEQQAELTKLSKESAAKSLSEASGTRKERDRILEQKTQAERDAAEAATKAAADAATAQQQPPSNATMDKFRDEQKTKAIARLKAEMGLTDDQTTEVVNHFNKIDSGMVDADNILQELRGAYAFVNRDTLLTADAEKRKREQDAADAEAQAAGGAQGDPSGSTPPKFSEGVKTLAKEAGITPEAAQKVATQGTKRVYE